MFYKYYIYIYHIYPQYPSANDLHLHFSLGSPVPPQRKLSVPTLFQTFLSDSKVAITIDLAFRILRQQETFKLIWEAILEKGNQKYNRNSSRFLQLQRRRRQKSNTNVQGFFHRIFLRRHLSKSTLVTRTGINFFKDAENHWTFFPRQRSSEVQGEKVVFVAGSGMSWAKQYLIQKSVWSGSPSLGLVEREEKADVFQPQKEDRIPNFMAKLKEQRLHDISMHVLDNDAVKCDDWRFGDWDDWSSVLKSKLKATEQPLQYPLDDCFTPSRCWHFAEILHTKKSLIFLLVDLLGWNHPFDLPNLASRWPLPLHKRLGTRANFHPPGQLLFGLHFLAQRHTEILEIWVWGSKRPEIDAHFCRWLHVGVSWLHVKKVPLFFFRGQKTHPRNMWCYCFYVFLFTIQFVRSYIPNCFNPKAPRGKPFVSTETGCPD